MSLLRANCTNCGGVIRPETNPCPHCGIPSPLTAARTNNVYSIVNMIKGLVFFGIIGAICYALIADDRSLNGKDPDWMWPIHISEHRTMKHQQAKAAKKANAKARRAERRAERKAAELGRDYQERAARGEPGNKFVDNKFD
jgi:hypothetical protein